MIGTRLMLEGVTGGSDGVRAVSDGVTVPCDSIAIIIYLLQL